MPSILFENDDFFIINKPPGIEFHGESGVISLLRKEQDNVFGVHRLDKETSGLMIFAKSKEVEKELKKLFAEKSVQKFYFALATQKPKKKMGMIKGDLEKSRGGSYKLSRLQRNPSLTKFISYPFPEAKYKFLILRPMTGKTHQLRVICQSLGASILGDQRYKGEASDRMYLHAFRLKFKFKNEDFDFKDYSSQGELFELIHNFDFSKIDWAFLMK